MIPGNSLSLHWLGWFTSDNSCCWDTIIYLWIHIINGRMSDDTMNVHQRRRDTIGFRATIIVSQRRRVGGTNRQIQQIVSGLAVPMQLRPVSVYLSLYLYISHCNISTLRISSFLFPCFEKQSDHQIRTIGYWFYGIYIVLGQVKIRFVGGLWVVRLLDARRECDRHCVVLYYIEEWR